MRCLECGHSNPESNKFCGECGARLQARAAKVDIAPESSSNLERRDTERERLRDSGAHVSRGEEALLSSVIVKAEFPPATPEEEAEEERSNVAADAMPTRSMRAAGISGPSILGLGYETAANPEGFVDDKPRRDGFVYDTDGSSPEYLLEETPGRSVSWRAWVLFAVLAIAGGLGYLQWRANRGQGPNLMSMLRGYAGAAASKPAPAANASTAATNAPASASSTANTQPPNAANTQPTNSQPAPQTNSTASSTTAPEQATDSRPSTSTISSDSEDSDLNNDAGTAPAATAKQPNAPAQTSPPNQTAQGNQPSPLKQAAQPSEASQASDEDNNETPSTPTDEVAKTESDRTTRSTAKPARPKPVSAEAVPAAAPKPKPLGDKDPLIVKAENYIQGRGTPKNCSAAVNLLRQSVGAGNPEADVKLGALYWSGTCVTQNKVTAYQWFTRAHTLEPTNRWIERSRNSMWASMNEREKQLATY